MKHLFRILSSIILAATFIYAIVNTYTWQWLTIEVVGFFVMCYVIIKVDQWIMEAHEMPDDFE